MKLAVETFIAFMFGAFFGMTILALPIILMQEAKIELEYVKKYSECIKDNQWKQ